jgi:hypothetical protein
MLLTNFLLFSPILYIVLGFITIFILKIFNINSTIHLAIVRFIAFLSIAIVYLTNNYIDDFIIVNPEIYKIAVISLSSIYGLLFLVYILAYFKFL